MLVRMQFRTTTRGPLEKSPRPSTLTLLIMNIAFRNRWFDYATCDHLKYSEKLGVLQMP